MIQKLTSDVILPFPNPPRRRIRTVCRHEKLLFGGKTIFDVLFEVAGPCQK